MGRQNEAKRSPPTPAISASNKPLRLASVRKSKQRQSSPCLRKKKLKAHLIKRAPMTKVLPLPSTSLHMWQDQWQFKPPLLRELSDKFSNWLIGSCDRQSGSTGNCIGRSKKKKKEKEKRLTLGSYLVILIHYLVWKKLNKCAVVSVAGTGTLWSFKVNSKVRVLFKELLRKFNCFSAPKLKQTSVVMFSLKACFAGYSLSYSQVPSAPASITLLTDKI